jgi:hypothetical protein
MAFSDARNERDRADTGRNSGNHGGGNAKDAADRNRSAMSGGRLGGGGARGTLSQQQDRANAARRGGAATSGGARGVGSSTAADHRVAIGNVRAPSIPAGGVAQGNYPTQDDAYADFAKAVGKHATRGFFDKALDWGLGGFYDPKEPMAGNPRSFAGSDFHSTTNPGSVLGGLIGMFGGGVGSVLGKVAGPAYTGLGLPEVWHGGYGQPDLRTGPLGNTTNPMGGSMADIGAGHTYPSGGAPGGGWAGVNNPQPGGGTGNGGQMASIGQQPGVQPVRPAGTPAAASPQMAWQSMQPAMLGGPVPGLQNYSVNTPGYNFLGSVGAPQQQQAAMFGRGVPRRG